MADLFGDSGGSGDEDADSPSSPEVPTTNGHSELGDLAPEEAEETAETHENGLEEEAKDDPDEYTERGPRDDIKVSVLRYQKTADDFTYDVEVEVNEKKTVVHRQYKELLWLHRNLKRRVELGGNILPPMPPPPPKGMDPKVAIFGKECGGLYGDHERLHCLGVEMFLQTLADHRFFSENDTVHSYLVKEQVVMDEKLGSGTLWSTFTKAISDVQKSGVQDPEQEFIKYLKNVEEVTPKLQAAAKAFTNLVSVQQSLVVTEFLLAEMLVEHANWLKETNPGCSTVVEKMSGGISEEKSYLVAAAFDGRHSLGFTLDLYCAYCTEVKEMLYRRLSKLQTLLTCTTQLDKAKPEKKAAAELAKEEADRAFKAISDTAKREMELYVDQYARAFRGNLIGYAEAQIHHSKKAQENLTRLRDELAGVELDEC